MYKNVLKQLTVGALIVVLVFALIWLGHWSIACLKSIANSDKAEADKAETARIEANYEKIKELETQPPGRSLEIVEVVQNPVYDSKTGHYIVRDKKTGVHYFATLNSTGFSVSSPVYDANGKVVVTDSKNATPDRE